MDTEDLLPVCIAGTTSSKVVVWGVDLGGWSRGGGRKGFGLILPLEKRRVEFWFLNALAVVRPCCSDWLHLHLKHTKKKRKEKKA